MDYEDIDVMICPHGLNINEYCETCITDSLYLEKMATYKKQRFEAAKAAMEGILSNAEYIGVSGTIALEAVKHADALLKELDK